MTNGPSFIIRHVPDVPAARKFYTEALGMQVEEEHPGFVQFANTGGATFALGAEGQGDAVELWWFTENVDGAHDELRSRGVEIVRPPQDEPFGRTLAVKDAAGGAVYLLQLPAQE